MDKRKKMFLIFIAIIVLLVVAILLVVMLWFQNMQAMNSLVDRVAALEAANRKSLNHFTAEELMEASYALNLFRSQIDLLENANNHLRNALNPERKNKK